MFFFSRFTIISNNSQCVWIKWIATGFSDFGDSPYGHRGRHCMGYLFLSYLQSKPNIKTIENIQAHTRPGHRHRRWKWGSGAQKGNFQHIRNQWTNFGILGEADPDLYTVQHNYPWKIVKDMFCSIECLRTIFAAYDEFLNKIGKSWKPGTIKNRSATRMHMSNTLFLSKQHNLGIFIVCIEMWAYCR